MENHAKRKRRLGPHNSRSLSLSSYLETHLSQVPLCGKDQRGKGREGLEGTQIGIRPVLEGGLNRQLNLSAGDLSTIGGKIQ